jgi:hypothetical protein
LPENEYRLISKRDVVKRVGLSASVIRHMSTLRSVSPLAYGCSHEPGPLALPR